MINKQFAVFSYKESRRNSWNCVAYLQVSTWQYFEVLHTYFWNLATIVLFCFVFDRATSCTGIETYLFFCQIPGDVSCCGHRHRVNSYWFCWVFADWFLKLSRLLIEVVSYNSGRWLCLNYFSTSGSPSLLVLTVFSCLLLLMLVVCCCLFHSSFAPAASTSFFFLLQVLLPSVCFSPRWYFTERPHPASTGDLG